MLKHSVALVLALLLSLVMQSAHAFFDPPYITPANPTAGQPVSVNIYGGECDGIIGMPGYPQITQNGNAIRILFLSVHYDDPTFCNIGVGTATQIVGTYAPGDYTLQVDHHEPGGLPQTLGVIPFTVTGTVAPPIQAPTLNSIGLALLVTCLLGIMAWTLRSRASYLLLIALTFLSPNLRAQEIRESGRMIEVLLTTSPGAPTAKQVVDYYARPSGTPPLATLASTNPERVQYLLSIRAEGDFLERLEANPNSVRAGRVRFFVCEAV